jgi:hypothetical protein
LLCRAEIGGRLQGIGQRFLAVFGSDLDSVGGNKFRVRDADKAEHPAQIGFQMFAGRRRRAGAVKAAARDRDAEIEAARAKFDGRNEAG